MHKTIGKISYPVILFFVLLIIPICSEAQIDDYTYGTVIGGNEGSGNDRVTSLLDNNEEGIRVTLINSGGRASGNVRRSSGSGGVQIYDVPRDTDYFELIVFIAGINPRYIRKGKIQILRIDSAGTPPYLSKNIKRYWTEYDFAEDYDRGGPFDVIQPGDIIIVQGKGLINRPFFDPIADIRFLLSLSSLALSVISVYNIIRN